jgi:hypothetical protein
MLISWSWTTYPLECPLCCLAARLLLAPLPVSLPLSSLGFLLGLLGLCPLARFHARFALPLLGPAFFSSSPAIAPADTQAASIHEREAHRTARANGGGHVEDTPCSVPLRLFGHDPLKENAVRYVMQGAIFGAKGNRSVAKVFDYARHSVN